MESDMKADDEAAKAIDVQQFYKDFNEQKWEEVKSAIRSAKDFHLDNAFQYQTSLFFFSVTRETTYEQLFINANQLTRDVMEAALERDAEITQEQLVDDLINAKSIGAKQAIAARIARNPGSIENSEELLTWLRGISPDGALAAEYNEIVENLVKAKIFTIRDALLVHWTNYSKIGELLQYDEYAKATTVLYVEEFTNGSTFYNPTLLNFIISKDEVDISALKHLLERDVTAEELTNVFGVHTVPEKEMLLLETFIARNYKVNEEFLRKVVEGKTIEILDKLLAEASITAETISAVMLQCNDKDKMLRMAHKLTDLNYKVEGELQDKLRKEFKDSHAVLLEAGKVASTVQKGRLWNGSDLEEHVKADNLAVLAGYVKNQEVISDKDQKIIQGYIKSLSGEKLNTFYSLASAPNSSALITKLIAETHTALDLYTNGNTDILKQLIDSNQLDITPSANKDNLLHHVIANNHYELADYLIKSNKIDLHAPGEKGITPIMLFAAMKHTDLDAAKKVMDSFLSYKNYFANVNEIDFQYFLSVCSINNPALVVYVIDSQSEAEAKINYIHKIFAQACVNGDAKLVATLIERYSPSELNINQGLELETITGEEISYYPLTLAYKSNFTDLFKVLLNAKDIDIAVKTEKNVPIFHEAVVDRNTEVLIYIMNSRVGKSVDVNGRIEEHDSALIDAMIKLDDDSATKVITDKDIEHFTGLLKLDPISTAVVDKSTKSTPALILYQSLINLDEQIAKAEVTVKASGIENNKILKENIQILKSNRTKLSTLLGKFIEHRDFDPMYVNDSGVNILNLAIARGEGDSATINTIFNKKELFQENLTARDSNGFIQLLNLIAVGNIEVFGKAKAFLNPKGVEDGNPLQKAFLLRDAKGIDALMAAAISGNGQIFFDIKKYVEDKQIDFNRKDDFGNALLHYAVGNVDIVESLLASSDIDMQNKDGLTPLSFAVNKQDIKTLELLIAHGADVNIPDKSGMTPLMYAILSRNDDVIDILLTQRNLDINAKNKQGLSAFMLAALTDDRFQNLTNNKDELDKALKELDKELGQWKGSDKVMTKLVHHGANPTFGKLYESIGVNLVSSLLQGMAVIKGTEYVNKYLKFAGNFAPVPAVSKFMGANIIQSTYAAWRAGKNFQDTSSMIHPKVMAWLDRGPKIDLNPDKLMIGAFSYGRYGGVKYGEDLRDTLRTYGIYNQDGNRLDEVSFKYVEQVIRMRNDSRLQDHDDMVTRYFAIKKELSKWQTPWGRSDLKALKHDVINADKQILSYINAKIADVDPYKKLEKQLLSLIAGENRDKIIHHILTHPDDHNYDDFKSMVQSIRENKVVASIEVIDAVYEFEARTKQIKRELVNPSLFTKIFRTYNKPVPESANINFTSGIISKLIAGKNTKYDSEKSKKVAVEVEKKPSSGILSNGVDVVAKILGKKADDIAQVVAGAASYIGGTAAFGITIVTHDSEFRQKYATAGIMGTSLALQTGAIVTRVAGYAVSAVVSGATLLAPAAISAAPAIAGVIVGGVAASTVYKYLNTESPKSNDLQQVSSTEFSKHSCSEITNFIVAKGESLKAANAVDLPEIKKELSDATLSEVLNSVSTQKGNSISATSAVTSSGSDKAVIWNMDEVVLPSQQKDSKEIT